MHDPKQAYEALHDTAAQAKFRRMQPWPVGAVFVQWPDMSEEDIRTELRKMKAAGFTCLKQAASIYDEDRRRLMHIALDEGILPWWYEEAGWEDPTPALALELGLPEDTPPDKIMADEGYKARQMRLMRDRIDREGEAPHMTATAEIDDLPGTVKKHEYGLPPEMAGRFVKWLQAKYTTVEQLKWAWNFQHYGIRRFQADTWEEVEGQVIAFVNAERGEYNRMMDVLRFKVDLFLSKLANDVSRNMQADPERPLRAGGEMSLFLPTPLLSTDMERIADLIATAGSYYPSIHLAWHFDETGTEFVRPIYMQAALAADYMKHGWAATWESTGGPQQFTGGKGGWWDASRRQTPSFTVDGGVMRQLMLSWVAAGFKGFGLWTWNARTAGWEGGEYGLTDKDGEMTDRAWVAGAVGKACKRYKAELWSADKAPAVGVYVDWENEALWAAMSIGGRDHFRSQGILARIGLCRALIDAGIPFEFVTPSQLRAGIAGRYQMIYLTATMLVQSDMLGHRDGELLAQVHGRSLRAGNRAQHEANRHAQHKIPFPNTHRNPPYFARIRGLFTLIPSQHRL